MVNGLIRAYLLAFLLMLCLLVHAGEMARGPVPGLTVEKREKDGISYIVAHVRVDQAPLHLYWKNDAGVPYRNFTALRRSLDEKGERLVFATNAGIYARDHTPLGLHVEIGHELRPLNLKNGGGNFFLKPNGVFYVAKGREGVLSAEDYAAAKPQPDLAVQSGPVLLRHGEVHPRFVPGSASRYTRNGVGVVSDTEAVFVFSEQPVNFYDFALFFRDELGCKDAVYLDGAISGMYAPSVGRDDPGLDYVGMLGISEPKDTGGPSTDKERP
jgi:uncharacterized protein YigE (DUF2233 family)